jgi:hypothetical protein
MLLKKLCIRISVYRMESFRTSLIQSTILQVLCRDSYRSLLSRVVMKYLTVYDVLSLKIIGFIGLLSSVMKHCVAWEVYERFRRSCCLVHYPEVGGSRNLWNFTPPELQISPTEEILLTGMVFCLSFGLRTDQQGST